MLKGYTTCETGKPELYTNPFSRETLLLSMTFFSSHNSYVVNNLLFSKSPNVSENVDFFSVFSAVNQNVVFATAL